jgi:hypothetical protein
MSDLPPKMAGMEIGDGASTLTKEHLDRSREFVERNGRALDRARFAHRFDRGPATDVVAALTTYQNDDGGFGHGLEPDMHTTASSAVATTLALGLLGEVDAKADDPVVIGAVGYLLDTFDHASRRWPIVPAEVETAPHAPWWNYAEIDETFHRCELNPMAATVAGLHRYSGLVPADFLAAVTATVLARLQVRADAVGVDEFRTVSTLAETPGLSDEQRDLVRTHALRQVARSVEFDPDRWGEYRLQPLDVLPTPDSFLAGAMDAAVVERNLDFWVRTLRPDGSWPLTWSWAEVDADAWARAERDGACVVLIERLGTLRAHGRIEGQG